MAIAAAEEESDIDVHIGKRLRLRRRALAMSQTELASAIGVRFQQIQKYETGVGSLSSVRLWEVSVALGVAPTYFFEGFRASGQADPTASDPTPGRSENRRR